MSVKDVERRPVRVAALILALASAGCWGEPEPVVDPARLTIKLTSPAFAEGGLIPAEYACDGPGGSPALEWSSVPEAARELSLIVDDPDAPMGTFAHWVVVGLPPSVKGLAAGVPPGTTVPSESIVPADSVPSGIVIRQGTNDFGKPGYGGPCPPSGTHRYAFQLYALDAPLALGEGSPKRSDVLKAIKGHILAEGRLTGRYARTK